MEVNAENQNTDPKKVFRRWRGIMSKVVARMAKMKIGNLAGIQRHNQRETDNHSNEDIDTDRSNLNYDLVNVEPIKYKEQIHEIINSQRKSTRAIRKDAVLVDEWIVTSDKNFFENLQTPEETRQFFQTAVEYFSDRCGSQNIAYATVHLDETTPHMHMGIVPMVDGRLSSKAMFSRQALKEIQEEFPKYLRDKGYEIERGFRGSEQQHLSVPEYKEVQQKVAEVKQEIPKLEMKRDVLEQQIFRTKKNLDFVQKTSNYKDFITKHILSEGKTTKLLGKEQVKFSEENFNHVLNDKIEPLYKSSRLLPKIIDERNQLLDENKQIKLAVSKVVDERTKELRRTITDLQLENADLKNELTQTEQDVAHIVKKSELFLTHELGADKEKVEVFKAYLGKGKSLNFTWEFLQPANEKISKLADKVLKKISSIAPLPAAIRFITKVVTKGIDLKR